jgi:hypothetical protein
LRLHGGSGLSPQALRSPEAAAKALNGRARLELMAGFEGATRYFGTLLPTGWSWEKKLAGK